MDTFCCAVQVARSLYDVKRLTGLGVFFQAEERNEKERRYRRSIKREKATDCQSVRKGKGKKEQKG